MKFLVLQIKGPILEEAAIKSGGMFRLVKVNSDAERLLSTTLDVTGLPSVFAVINGKVNDRCSYSESFILLDMKFL